jgi:hypothetical protein
MTTLLVTVNPMPAAITGSSSVCSGSTITLHDVSTGGIWSSSSTSIATVGSTSGVVAGVSPGVVNITYAMPTGCSATKSITVSTPPVAGSITGSTSVCTGASITLTDPVPGGTWSASNGHATVTGSGEVTGVSGGVDTIMYSVTSACGTATATYPVVVTGLPDAGTISGLLNICVGRTAMLTSSGGAGIWSTSNANASISVGGIVTGIAAGTDTVSFTVTNACGTAVATAIVTVLAPANAGTVTGAATVCPGSTIHLSNTVTGGIWAAGNVNATVSPTGDVTGVFPGTVSVMYIVITSCNVDTAAHLVVVKTEAECINSVNPSAVRTEELKIYPNPSSGSFAIELPESVSSGEMTITDVTGKVVSRGMLSNTNGDRVVMAMPDVASGAYLVRIDSDGRTFRKTLLIVK